MPKMKYFDSATSKWIELDAKNADTLGGKSASEFANSSHTHTASDLPNGTTGAKGIVQLSSSTSSTSTTLASTPSAVRLAYNKAVDAESNAKSYTDAQLANFSPKVEAYKHVLASQFDGQKGFDVVDIFNPTTDTLIDVTQNGWGLSAEKYVIDNGNIYLLEGVSKGTQIAFTILKNVPLKEQQSQLIAGDLMAGYYGKVNGLITGNELFAKTGLTAGTTLVSGDITWLKFSHNYKTLFVADRGLKNSISWDDIQAQDLVKGKVVEIDGKQYLCRLMSMSNTNPSTTTNYGNRAGHEWSLLIKFTPASEDNHWTSLSTLTQQIYDKDIDGRLQVGGSDYDDIPRDIDYVGWGRPDTTTSSLGYRPVLELL